MKTTKRQRREAKRLYRACLVEGLLDDHRVRVVAQRVGESRRRASLAILSHFGRLVRLDRQRHLAVVATAEPLPPDLAASIETGITSRYGPGTTTDVVVNPALIGGMRVQVGSDVYDGSVRAALAALEERF